MPPNLRPLKAKENPENSSWNLNMLAPYGYSSQLGCATLGVWLHLSEPQFCHLETRANNRAFRNSYQNLRCRGLSPEPGHNMRPADGSSHHCHLQLCDLGEITAPLRSSFDVAKMRNDNNNNACPGAVRRFNALIPIKPLPQAARSERWPLIMKPSFNELQ